MARTVAQIDDDITNVREAMGSGELEVQIGDKRTRYRSMAELQRALDTLNGERQAVDAPTTVNQPRHTRFVTTTGW